MMIGDFHIHTKYSFDSLNDPKKALKIAKKKGIDTVAITDHNSIKGAKIAKKYEKAVGINVIIGIEKKTDVGDIIGLNIAGDIRAFQWEDVIDEIRSQGGVAVLPHPYKGHKNVEDVAKRVDLIEVWNSRCSLKENELAMKLAGKLNKGVIAGSDAHTYWEIGNTIISLNYLGDTNFKLISKKTTRKTYKVLSYLIGDVRQKQIKLIPYHLSLLVRKI